MGHGYRTVQWTPFKVLYDAALLTGVAVFTGVFILASFASAPPGEAATPIQMLIRATGSTAFGILTLILLIGPLSRFSRSVLPILSNRRHLGVACFLIALAHAGLVVLWYHGFSDLNPLVSLLISNPRYTSIGGFPFEALGVGALIILFVMAATSHDFWNAQLGPGLWKTIHMGVYPAYGLLTGHILLGAVQGETSLLYPVLTGAAAALVAGLHIAAGVKSALAGRPTRRGGPAAKADAGLAHWLDAGPAKAIPDGRAVIVTPPTGERIAVFRDGARIHAVSNVCRHQGGPLGEGRIIDGCVTCPWHGFQYRAGDGASPPPYTEKIATYRTRVLEGRVLVDPAPLPPGTPVDPSLIDGDAP